MNAAMETLKGKIIPVLDDGHISLVDYMGDDNAIVDAARVSFFGHSTTNTPAQNRHLLRYLMRCRHCYDEDTEVLTSEGFRLWSDVWAHFKEYDKQYDAECGIRLGVWDPEAATLCYEVPEYITCDPYNGEMYRVDHGGVDLLVTPDHKMWVRLKDQWDAASKSQGWSGHRLIPANELGNRSMVRYSKLAPMVAPAWTGEGFPACNDPQALLEFIGFFIGDGSARGSRTNGVTFHLVKDREISFLTDCVQRLGWPLHENKAAEGKRRFVVSAPGIGTQFEKMFYWSDNKKHLPDWCLLLDRDDAAALLNGMRHSDGSEKRGAWVYYTGSARLAEQTQILGLHAGDACSISRTDNIPTKDPEFGLNLSDALTKDYDPMYRVMFLSRMREPVINQGKQQTSMVPYDGMVYCAKTRTGILVVRRNGKIVLSGNTTPFEMCELKIRVRVPMDAWRQWIRHRTANVNESSTRYAPAIDSAQRVTEWRSQSKDNKQGSAGVVADFPDGFRMEGVESIPVGDIPETAAEYLSHREAQAQAFAREVYEERLSFGVAKEVARKDLPLSTYTEAYWKMDLHNLFHFLGLRLDPHAQLEIRSYAQAIAEIVKVWVPWAWEAFEDYRLQGMVLTTFDVQALRSILSRLTGDGYQADKLIEGGLAASGLGKGRERKDLVAKLQRLLAV